MLLILLLHCTNFALGYLSNILLKPGNTSILSSKIIKRAVITDKSEAKESYLENGPTFFLLIVSVVAVLTIFDKLRKMYGRRNTNNQNNENGSTSSSNEPRTWNNTNSSASNNGDNNSNSRSETAEPAIIAEEEIIPTDRLPELSNYISNLEIDEKNIIFQKDLGEGAFGKVFKGLLKMADPKTESDRKNGLVVAIKKPKNHDREMVFDELKVICYIQYHPNVLALVGAVTLEGNYLIVTEYMNEGDLRNYLINSRSTFTTKQSSSRKQFGTSSELSISDLYSFAYQIANGMSYLALKKCVHRDLALRNVLVSKNRVIRIADFGLARKHKDREYYKANRSLNYGLPMHWMSPELWDQRSPAAMKFTEATDSWSFGVCLFELFSLGETPYGDLPNAKDVDAFTKYLDDGNRLPEPEHCDKETYQLMRLCWSVNAKCRPQFGQCEDYFREKLSKEQYDYIENLLRQETEKQKELRQWVEKKK